MKNRTPARVATVCAVVAAATLSACVATVPIKDMIADRETFLSTNFAATKLQPGVKAAVDKKAVPSTAFKSMRLSFNLVSEEEGRKRDVEGTMLILNAGNGLFQRQSEMSANGFPYRINNQLDYRGLRPLTWQSGFHNRQQSEIRYEIKEIKRFDTNFATAKAGDELLFEGSSGNSEQVTNYTPLKYTCKVGDTVAASTIHAALTGDAVKLACTSFDNNGVAASKSTYAFLKSYGVALTLDYSASRGRDDYTYTKVDIQK
jgi:hypothetical protein